MTPSCCRVVEASLGSLKALSQLGGLKIDERQRIKTLHRLLGFLDESRSPRVVRLVCEVNSSQGRHSPSVSGSFGLQQCGGDRHRGTSIPFRLAAGPRPGPSTCVSPDVSRRTFPQGPRSPRAADAALADARSRSPRRHSPAPGACRDCAVRVHGRRASTHRRDRRTAGSRIHGASGSARHPRRPGLPCFHPGFAPPVPRRRANRGVRPRSVRHCSHSNADGVHRALPPAPPPSARWPRLGRQRAWPARAAERRLPRQHR